MAGLVAGITMRYTYDKVVREKQIHRKPKTTPGRAFKRRPIPATVKAVYPDRQTLSHNLKSPIWVEFDAPMDSSTITKDTVIVKNSVSDKPVDGFLDAGDRILMFRPYANYPMENGGARVSITLIGTDSGSGAITDTKGVPLDGDNDGKAGGDFEYKFNIVR
ncbi:Ig-like domain-containing protein [Methanosarcina sp. MSH10X1]|uniref:Ig-like domain-containing protein n=1 Tax=Methanosarcina sp. MSH10X1 TaxID=2507075 RepID=UPI001F0BDC12|nr:Ig-like domain-containing protein [Methanosarcina sp. MSH10X1]